MTTDKPVLRYSFTSDAVQYDNLLELYADGSVSAVHKVTMHPGSEDRLRSYVGVSKVRDLVQRVKDCVTVGPPNLRGNPEFDFHEHILIETNDTSIVYVDAPPSQDVERLTGDLDTLFYSLHWPK